MVSRLWSLVLRELPQVFPEFWLGAGLYLDFDGCGATLDHAMRASVENSRSRKSFLIPVVTVRPTGPLVDSRSRLALGALPILQFKELEVDQERYEAWKASLDRSREPRR